ncbi:MAG: cobalamin B12-binding domain-containing protein [Candidatus Jordarchaeum sp.]|uniref:cobalamin B12-binding domain-containing protein n=1 Tax=Candidatus Jordarchaeum sp. TaxID=2823881 RepID=UPI00404AEAC3
MPEDLVKLIVSLDEKKAVDLVRKKVNAGEDPLKILDQVRTAMAKVGDKFEKKEFFLPDLIMSGEILRQIAEILEPKLKAGSEVKRLGKIVLGTVFGDIHDIGKDVVKFIMDANGFDVTDLGVDVPKEKFVEAIKTENPDIVALSGFLTLAYDSMKETIKEIEKAGLRDKVKIMIGGGQMDETIRKYVNADAYGKDAVEAVAIAKKWVGA